MSDQFTYDPVVPEPATATKETPQPQFSYEPITGGPAPEAGTPTQDVSTFMSDPVDAKQRAAISVISAQSGIPHYSIDAISKSPSAVKDWKGGLDFAAKQREIDALSFKQALGDRTPELATQIKDLQSAQQADPKASLLQNLVSGAGEQGAAGLRAGGMWLLGALSWPYRKLAEATGLAGLKDKQNEMLSTIGQNFGLSQERTTAIISNPLTGLGESAKEATAGITGPTYRMLVDQHTNPDVAAGASFALGGILTALQAIPAGRLIPGAQRIGEESFKAAVIAVAKNGGLLGLAKLWSTRVATIGAEQAALGAVNATTQVLGEEWARQYSNLTKGTAIPATSFADLTRDILIQGATQAGVGTAIGGLTALREIKPTYEMGAKLRSWVEDVRAARATNVTQGEPAPVVKALPLPDTKAPMEEARALIEQTPQERSPQAIADTQAKLNQASDAIVDNPTPDTVPKAIEAAKASDVLSISQTSSVAKIDETTGLPLNPDGTVTLYHGTTKEGAASIQATGKLKAAGEPDVYLSTAKEGTGYGDGTVIPIRVNPSQLQIDDEFPGGRKDFRIDTGKPGGSVTVQVGDIPPGNVEQSVKAGVPVEDATLSAIPEPWARSEIEHRMDVRDTAVEMFDSGSAMDAQEFASLMKSTELPGAEKPVAWYESQWDNMEKQRLSVESAKNDEFLNTLNKDELQTTLKDIANNPDAVASKALGPWLEKAKAGMSQENFQSFVTEAAKNPGKWRRAIEQGMDPEARQQLQDRVAEGMASKVTKSLANDALLKQNADVRIGELTTSSDPVQQKAAQLVAKLLRSAMKEPSSAIAYDSRVKIQDLQDSISLESGPRLRTVRDRLRTYYEQHPDTPPDANTSTLLSQRLSGDMTVKELQSLAEQIDAERSIGKDLQTIKRVNERNLIETDRANVIKEIMGSKPFERTTDVGSRQEKKQRKGNLLKRGESVVWSPLRLVDRMGPTTERYYREVQDARDAEWRGTDPRIEPLVQKAKDFGILPRTLAKIITAPNGKEYTVSDVLAMKWAMTDEGAREHLIDGNGIPEEAVNEMVGKLPANVAEYADAIAKTEGLNSWDRLRRAYIEDTNSKPPPKIENHFPIRVQDKQYETPGSAIADDMMMRGGIGIARVNKRMMLGRKQIAPKNQSALRLDGVALAFESIRQQEHYIASWEIAKRLKRVFLDDRNVRDAITQKFGNSWNDGIKSWINSFSSPDAFQMTTPADRFSTFMRHALTSSGIVFNAVTWGYNLTGPLMAMGDAGPRRLMTSMGKWLADPKGMYDRVITALPQVKHASIDPVMNAMRNADPSTYKSMMRMTEELGYKPLELIDMWTRLVAADAVHQHAIDTNPSMSDSDAWYKALESIQRNQPSGEAQDLPMMYHAKSLQMFLVFSRQLNQIWNMMTADIPLAIKQGKMLEAVGSIFGIAISGFLIAMMGNKRPPKDLKEALQYAADQFVVSVPFVGNILEPLLIGQGYMNRGAEIIPGAQQTATDIKGIMKRSPMADRVDHAVRTLIDVSRFFGAPAVAEKRVYDFIKTGDPWGLVGGRPKK